MNEKFFQLSSEKQNAIINAALEVFAKNEYKHASTEIIAVKAGISKGLLFHYFHNKKELYMYLLEYTQKMMKTNVATQEFFEITDFFEILEYGAKVKYKIIAQNPYIMEFSMRAFLSSGEEVSNNVNKLMEENMNTMFETYFKNIDFSRFRDGIDPRQLIQMLMWMTEGYIHQSQYYGGFDIDKLMAEFHSWAEMFKKIAYK